MLSRSVVLVGKMTRCVPEAAVLLFLVLFSQPLQAQASTVLFPDYVVGDGWSVQLALGNLDPNQPVSVVVEVYDQQGDAVSEFFDSGSRFELPPLGSRILKTDDEGAIRRGWIAVRSEAASVSGLLTYQHAETGVEVGVGPVELGDQFALFVEESSGIGTGLAVYNPDQSLNSEFEYHIRDEAGNLPDNMGFYNSSGWQHEALTVLQWFFGDLPTDFRGLMFLGSQGADPFAPLGLRFGKQTSSLSAVPVVPILDSAGSAPTDGGNGARVYAPGDRVIFRRNLDGTQFESLVGFEEDDPNGFGDPSDLELDLDGGKMYWADRQGHRIQRANLDGTQVETLISELGALGLGEPTALELDLDGGKMYWIDGHFNKIQRANLDGTQVEDLRSTETSFSDLEVDPGAGKMYWIGQGARIRRANLDGSGFEDLVPIRQLGLVLDLELDLDAGKIYWAEQRTHRIVGAEAFINGPSIRRANLDGTKLEDVVSTEREITNQPRALELDLDAGKIYWSDYIRGNTLLRSDLSGTNEEIVFTTGDSAAWLDFEVDNDRPKVGDYGFLFPDYVVGESWSVQLALGSLHPDQSASVIVEVRDQQGERISEFFDSGYGFELPARGSRVLRSIGGGAIRRGWISVETNIASLSGLLTYRNAQTGIEVGVKPVDLGNHFALFVEESSDIGTGLAIYKPDPASIIEFQMRDESGSLIGEVLSPGDFQQSALTILEWFRESTQQLPAEFRGLLLLRGVDGASFTPVGLRFGKRSGSLSAVPVNQVAD